MHRAPSTVAVQPPLDFLILGIGNLLRSDDGVGVHAIQALRQLPPPGAWLVDAGTAVLHALAFVEKAARVLVIDALQGGQPPGTIYTLDLAQTQPTDWRFSVHSLGLREALRVLAPGKLPPPIAVIGVEPLTLDYGLKLSAPVHAALPQVLALARQTLADWQNDLPLAPALNHEPEFLPLTEQRP